MEVVLYGVVFVALIIVFLIVWISSFKPVRRRLGSGWKRLQRATAHPFYGLAMLAGMLVGLTRVCSSIVAFVGGEGVVPGQLEGFPTGAIEGAGTFWICLLIGLFYLFLRVSKAGADRAAPQGRATGRRPGA